MSGPTGIGLMNLAGLTVATLAELRVFFADQLVGIENKELRDTTLAWIDAIDSELDHRGAL